ncbi:MAG TPA: head GIN domain-containing protein [Bacteroidales bacterium]|nr:head GIN domain-containing protein [Bacteroidales bacterium]
MKKILFSGLIIVAIALTSCIKSLICIDGNGNVVTDLRDADQITKIVSTSFIDVVYRKADTSGIKLVAESNLISHIVTDVDANGRLEIRTEPKNRCLDNRVRIELIVSSPNLNAVDNTGSGSFQGDSLQGASVIIRSTGSGDLHINYIDSDNLKIEVTGSADNDIVKAESVEADISLTGSGDLSLGGSAENGTTRVTGSGNAKMSGFSLNTASAILTGSGNVYTRVTNSINVVISGSGNLYLTGNPSITQTITGSGRIIHQ